MENKNYQKYDNEFPLPTFAMQLFRMTAYVQVEHGLGGFQD